MNRRLHGLLGYHRFLANQSFYSIFLTTLLALALFAARALESQSMVYRNLVWNLLLAWLPFVFSFIAATFLTLYPRNWMLIILPGLLWLIFFPNAPYIVTDFLHLEDRSHVPLWYDIIMLATFAWNGCFLAIASLRTMQLIVKNFLGWFLSWVFAGVSLALCGLGIYLGRFSRWNSWDLFFEPKAIFRELAVNVINPLNNLQFIAFTVLFTAFLVVCYLTFMSIRKESGLLD
jgi:uncharacterized membrane protein